ncbi:MAG: hypothetical protein PHD09_07335 [Candidatus Omnitrophica bacterium]|nr:hypothetical protein [Candidatus Omnitrophota bacterium]
MDKKDIYEHLAKIYLDASQKRKKKNKKHPEIRNIILIFLSFLLGFGLFFFTIAPKKKPAYNSSFVLLLQPDIAKINFNFDPARKEVYSIRLNNLNLNKYDSLTFSVKKTNFRDTINLRVEFTNAFKEKSEIYIRDIPHKWEDFRIPFSDFKNINDWSDMYDLSFIVEEWNTKEDNGVVYVSSVGVAR